MDYYKFTNKTIKCSSYGEETSHIYWSYVKNIVEYKRHKKNGGTYIMNCEYKDNK